MVNENPAWLFRFADSGITSPSQELTVVQQAGLKQLITLSKKTDSKHQIPAEDRPALVRLIQSLHSAGLSAERIADEALLKFNTVESIILNGEPKQR